MTGNKSTAHSSLLYGDRSGQLLIRREGQFPPLNQGLMILTSAGYNRPGSIIKGVSHCGADLLHFADSRRRVKVVDPSKVTRRQIAWQNNLLQAAAVRYRAERRIGLYRLAFPDLSPLLIASSTDQHASLARAFSYIEETTDYHSFREAGRWSDDVIQALASLLHVAQATSLSVASAIEAMQAHYFTNLERWFN